MNKYFLASVLLATVLLAGCVQPEPQGTGTGSGTDTASEDTVLTGNVVERTGNGFEPSTLTISQGETVTFVNRTSQATWPASAVHPTHQEYPERGGCIGSAFDACTRLSEGDTYAFTFNESGTWQYHDHMSPSVTGTIIVE